MYRLSAYYLARSLADLPMDCLVPTLFTWVIYFMTGLRLDAGEGRRSLTHTRTRMEHAHMHRMHTSNTHKTRTHTESTHARAVMRTTSSCC